MPRLHFPRSSYDFSDCDFPYDFLDIIVDHGLATTHVYSSYGHRTISCSGFRRRSELEPYGDRIEIVGYPLT